MIVKLLTELHFGVSKLNRRLHWLVLVYACQNTTLLEIICQGSCYCFPDLSNNLMRGNFVSMILKSYIELGRL